MLATKRYSIHERIPQRVYTTDARHRHFDTLLSAVVTPRNPDMMGHMVWTGDLKPVGDAVARVKAALGNVRDRARLGDAIAKAVYDIAEYGNEVGAGLSSGSMRPSGYGSLGTGCDERPPEFDVSGGTSPRSINEANDAAWGRSGTRDSRGPALSTHATPQTIMAASRKMWADLLGRPASQDRVAVARDSVRCTNQTSPADINEMNRRFHSVTPEPSPFNRPFGKG